MKLSEASFRMFVCLSTPYHARQQHLEIDNGRQHQWTRTAEEEPDESDEGAIFCNLIAHPYGDASF